MRDPSVTVHAVDRWRERVGAGDVRTVAEAWRQAVPIPDRLQALVFDGGRSTRARRRLLVEPLVVLVEVDGHIVTVYPPLPAQAVALQRWARQLQAD